MVALGGGAVSCERGTPVNPKPYTLNPTRKWFMNIDVLEGIDKRIAPEVLTIY